MKRVFCILLAGGLLAGCESRGPVELRDSDLQGQTLQLLPLPAATAPEFSLADVDSDGTFAQAATDAFGQLTIVGVTSDDGTGGPARQASLVHAAFYDRNTPLIAGGRTVGYQALDFGTVTVDDLLITKAEKRFRMNGADTLGGVHYVLVDAGHLAGRGFQYTGNHLYEWRIGGGPMPGYRTTILSPPEIKLLGSANSNTIVLSHTLKLKWSRHIDLVRILISELLPDGTTRPLLHLQAHSSANGVSIPSSLLQTLRASSRVRLTVIAETTRNDMLPGYPDEIVLKAVSMYTTVMRINR